MHNLVDQLCLGCRNAVTNPIRSVTCWPGQEESTSLSLFCRPQNRGSHIRFKLRDAFSIAFELDETWPNPVGCVVSYGTLLRYPCDLSKTPWPRVQSRSWFWTRLHRNLDINTDLTIETPVGSFKRINTAVRFRWWIQGVATPVFPSIPEWPSGEISRPYLFKDG